MPVDASIPLAARPFSLGNAFGEAFAQGTALRAQQENADMLRETRKAEVETRRLAAEKAKQDAADREASDEAIRQGGGVRGATLAWATQKAPHALPGLTEFFDKSDKSAAEIKKLTGELNNARLNHLGHLSENVLAHGATPEAVQTGLALYAEQFPDEAEQAQALGAKMQQMAPPQIKGFLEQQRDAAPYWQERQQKSAERGPTKVSPGEIVLGPDNQPVYTAPAKQTFQAKDVMLDGKRANVNFDPGTGKYTDTSGQDVSTRVTPIPPASVIINNQRQQGATMPEFALTDARPIGPDGNKPDQTIRMTPNGLYQAAQSYIASGQYPPTGRGTDPISVAQREAINAKVGAIASATGMDVPTLRAFYKSNASSLAQTQKSMDAVQAFMTTADRNSELLTSAIKQIPESGIPLLNQSLRSFAKNVAGDPKMAKAATYLQSVANEYARIVSQPNLSGQLTDSARKEAEALLDPKATVQQMIASVEALRAEGNNRVLSLGEQISKIGARMQPGAAGHAADMAAAAPAAGVTIRARDPQGNIHEAAAGTKLPDGWVKVGG